MLTNQGFRFVPSESMVSVYGQFLEFLSLAALFVSGNSGYFSLFMLLFTWGLLLAFATANGLSTGFRSPF